MYSMLNLLLDPIDPRGSSFAASANSQDLVADDVLWGDLAGSAALTQAMTTAYAKVQAFVSANSLQAA